MVGVRGNMTPKLTGFLRAGYQTRDAGNSGLSETSGLAFSGDLAYQINPMASLSLGLLRDMSISPVSANTTMRTGGSIRGTYKVSKTVLLRASLVYYDTDYSNSTRNDGYFVGGVGATYKPNKYLSISADYNGCLNNSNVTVLDYNDNVLQVAVSVRY
jgi:polysaccharide biosynthesis protein VpsM